MVTWDLGRWGYGGWWLLMGPGFLFEMVKIFLNGSDDLYISVNILNIIELHTLNEFNVTN